MTAIPAKKIKEPQNGVKENSPGKGSPGRGNASLGKEELEGIADKMILLIDNYDSFTYNIVQYLSMLGGIVQVIQNDETEVDHYHPDYLVIGPGPGCPNDAGISKPFLKKFLGKIPILGVCLGHQCIGDFFGAKVLRAKQPMHGMISPIYHDAKGLFKGIKQPFFATRYHSLIVDKETLSNELIVSAITDDGEIMGLRHCSFPLEGVQFHPESVSTEHGLTIFQNFLNLKRNNLC